MGYIGSQPATNFETVRKQVSTTNSGTTITLDYSVSSVQDILVTVNAVVQSYDNYSVSGTTLTLGGTLNNDRVEILYVGRTFQTVTPATGTVSVDMLSASGTKSSSTFLSGDNSFKTVSGTTINNNADNRVITGSGTANTLEGEANLTFDGSTMALNKSGSNGGGLVTSITTEVGNTDSTGDGTSIAFDGELSNSTWRFGRVGGVNSGSNYGGTLVFHTNAGNGSGASTTTTERMNIDSSGRVNINTASAITGEGYLQVKGGTNLSAWQVESNGLVALRFFNSSGSGVGGITVNGSGTVYATSSDYRLKENEVAISDGIERLKQLKPYRFNFKTDVDENGNPTEIVDGFFAHEVSSVVPEAISGEKDGEEMQGIDQSKLVPLLTSALQEAITKIETLEARVQALENA